MKKLYIILSILTLNFELQTLNCSAQSQSVTNADFNSDGNSYSPVPDNYQVDVQQPTNVAKGTDHAYQSCMPAAICPQVTTFSSNVRGYFFTSPVAFTICGLFIPTDASTAAQSIEVLRFDSIAPPAYPAFINKFVSLFYTAFDTSSSMIPCNIPVSAGDTIGVYGARGNTTICSYATAPCTTSIFGNNVDRKSVV